MVGGLQDAPEMAQRMPIASAAGDTGRSLCKENTICMVYYCSIHCHFYVNLNLIANLHLWSHPQSTDLRKMLDFSFSV